MGTVPDATATLLPPSALAAADDDHTIITEFHITGFGRFHNVPVNPTELIVSGLPQYLEKNPLSEKNVLASSRIMKVAATSTRSELEKMYSQLDQPVHPMLARRSRQERRIVFIHLGINASVTNFQLEIQGRNEATFSCPDENGWTPIKRAIDPENTDITTTCRTTLNLTDIMRDLQQQGFKVEISTDAGRFVCNWTYFNSLKLAEKASACSLFVHVPPAHVIDVEKQKQFIRAVCESIARN